MNAQTPIKDLRRKTSSTRHTSAITTSSPSNHSPQPAAIPTNVPVSLSTVGEAAAASHERIATRAYQIWDANGRPAGTDYADWFEAESLLRVEPH
jgi:Protein of unknown function (DUF2934)